MARGWSWATAAVCAGGVCGAGLWAISGPVRTESAPVEIRPAAPTAVAARAAIDAAVFDAPIWNQPVPPQAPATPKAPPGRLHLVAIFDAEDPSARAAAIYDETTGETTLAAAGGSVGAARVVSIDPALVVLAIGTVEHRLTLDSGGGAPSSLAEILK